MNTWILVNIFALFLLRLSSWSLMNGWWHLGARAGLMQWWEGISPSTNVTQVQFGTGCHLWVEFAGFFPGWNRFSLSPKTTIWSNLISRLPNLPSDKITFIINTHIDNILSNRVPLTCGFHVFCTQRPRPSQMNLQVMPQSVRAINLRRSSGILDSETLPRVKNKRQIQLI